MHASGAELPSARNIPSRYAPPAKGRKGCKGRKPQVSFPCAADIQISPKAKQETLHACQSEAEPRWCRATGRWTTREGALTVVLLLALRLFCSRRAGRWVAPAHGD